MLSHEEERIRDAVLWDYLQHEDYYIFCDRELEASSLVTADVQLNPNPTAAVSAPKMMAKMAIYFDWSFVKVMQHHHRGEMNKLPSDPPSVRMGNGQYVRLERPLQEYIRCLGAFCGIDQSFYRKWAWEYFLSENKDRARFGRSDYEQMMEHSVWEGRYGAYTDAPCSSAIRKYFGFRMNGGHLAREKDWFIVEEANGIVQDIHIVDDKLEFGPLWGPERYRCKCITPRYAERKFHYI